MSPDTISRQESSSKQKDQRRYLCGRQLPPHQKLARNQLQLLFIWPTPEIILREAPLSFSHTANYCDIRYILHDAHHQFLQQKIHGAWLQRFFV